MTNIDYPDKEAWRSPDTSGFSINATLVYSTKYTADTNRIHNPIRDFPTYVYEKQYDYIIWFMKIFEFLRYVYIL